MTRIMDPKDFNATFARLYNGRDLRGLLQLYEPQAAHLNAQTRQTDVGLDAIEASLRALLQIPGRMVSKTNWCIVRGEIALLRGDWSIHDERGAVLADGSSVEVARRQADGSWRTLIDHAVGASVARVAR
ncbi:hypothetical protein M8A51_08760 [Schlegelella sp. S2-27]|uniref:DUF4440 domain-containing protein n=1 Tax=Caldimonas mangrovi TaxID=2944811 RepID=A0ABT0YMY9_9BURK|nr:hypothetical protein [Caldimonas mangrovi]MCM5679622.1 hypothetical protein [Caldimonas mangrovi]